MLKNLLLIVFAENTPNDTSHLPPQFVALDILMKHERDLILSSEADVLAAVKRGNTFKFVVDR